MVLLQVAGPALNRSLDIRGVGTGPADPATAGPKFSVHQERPQLINISYTLIARIKQLWNFIL